MNLGNALKALGRNNEALANYDRALSLQPNYAEVWANRGRVLKELVRHPEALASYDKAVALNPQLFVAWYNRGNALKDLARHEDAIASYRQALALHPDHSEANFNLGLALLMRGSTDEAVASFERVLKVEPSLSGARIARCIAELPVLYEDEAEIGRRRASYSEQLDRLAADTGQLKVPHAGMEACLPFFLAYQGLNDCELQRRFGTLVCRLTESLNPPAERLAGPATTDDPIRIGIVSGHFFFHSVWKIPIKGWLSQLDRRRFRLFCYHTTGIEDAETGVARSLCERFVEGPLSLEAWREEILADRPHVIIYPEIGMDPRTAQLAALRLAPVQCVSLGHPNTTGFPTIDYFLSSQPMEPDDGADHYTERLVQLPNLAIYYEPVKVAPAPISRQELGLRPGACVFWCGQSLFKYLPQHDNVFPRITKEVPDCQFVFIDYGGGSAVNDLFRKRLRNAFASLGLNSDDHCVFLGRMKFSHFSAAMGQCDIFLNSISWSGFNTTMESLEHDLPIVTMTMPLMRGRHTLAILKLMGIGETIAGSLDEYVKIAVRLANDPAWRAAIKAEIAKRKHGLYCDRSAVAALESFLEQAARSGRGLNMRASHQERSGMGIPDWLQQEVNDYFVKSLNVNPTTVLDIGANVGAFALRAHGEWPTARVICYEPMPFNIDALLKNVDATWCQVNPCAVRSQAGDADIYIGDMFVTGGFKRWGRQTEKTIRVPCVAANALPRCDLVKIDTEGCEVEILAGLDLTRTEAILLEYHSRADAETIVRMLTPRFTVLHKSGGEIGTMIFQRAT